MPRSVPARGDYGRVPLLESLLLGLTGGALGLGLAYGALELLIAIAPRGLPRLDDISLELGARILFRRRAFAGLVPGLFPVLKNLSSRISTGLHAGGGVAGRAGRVTERRTCS